MPLRGVRSASPEPKSTSSSRSAVDREFVNIYCAPVSRFPPSPSPALRPGHSKCGPGVVFWEHEERELAHSWPSAYPATVPGLWVKGLSSVRWDLVVGLSGASWKQF